MKRLLIVCLIVFVLIFGTYIFYNNKISASNNDFAISDLKAIETSEIFVYKLLDGDNSVLDLVTGDVKYNIAGNIDNLKKYNTINVNARLEYSSGQFAVTNVIAEYESNNSVDVMFYKFYLINENNRYLIYKLEESFSFANLKIENRELTEEMKMSKTDVFGTVEDYIKDLQNGELSLSSRHLIGKAKQNHDKSYQFISKAKDQIIIEISDINHEILASDTKDISVVKSTYMNGDRLVSILTTLYKTSEGWKIYDISQV